MAESLELDILTPTGAVEGAHGLSVPGVEIPGLLGELGVLPRHIPFVTPLVPGVVRFRDGDTSVRLAVGSGFLEVSEAGRVSILTERVARPEDIDLEAATAQRAEAEAELRGSTSPPGSSAHTKLEQRYRWLDAQVRAAS